MNIDAKPKAVTQDNGEEDGEWLAKQQIFDTKKQGCLPCFDFREFPAFKHREIDDMVMNLICTIRCVKCIDPLSPASLMEIGMCMAFCKNNDLQEHEQIRNVVQHAAWDCVASLQRAMDLLGV